jgi:hypothetical protein
MIAASVKYLVIGAATTPFASGFADDTRVYFERYPNLVQAHLIPSHAEEIDSDSFELALDSLLAGLEPLHASLTAGEGRGARGADGNGRARQGS